jgi:hypothetical protein
MFRRVATVVAVLALCAGNLAVCAGWQATPEARMACCVTSTDCPMHKSEGHHHSSNGSFSQTQADSCCATSAQRRDSSTASSIFASSGAIALVPVIAVTPPIVTSPERDCRALVPLPTSSTPKHLLLSILIV